MASLPHCRLTVGNRPQEAPHGARINYTTLCPQRSHYQLLIRHVGLILDELSSQGLDVWQDERRRWHWRWLGVELQAERGFWALGEAIVDAVVSRYPAAFDTTVTAERV